MKEYIAPKVRGITLDIEQAILNVCSIEGNYMSNGGICVGANGVYSESIFKFCQISNRGATPGPCLDTWSQDNAPS